jgi:membrane-bound metal-dependent hydrolase YbcI (DUF457 family)
MFIGHFGVAFGAKKYAPRVSLGFLFLACQLADLIWPSLVLLGVESFKIEPGNTVLTPLNFSHYPYSHSLLGLFIWGLLLAGLYALLHRGGVRAAVVIVLVVLSHWLLDFLTHRPDMPLTFTGNTLVGLGLWNYPVAAVSIELLLYAAGIWLYVRQTRALDRIGQYGLWGVVIFLLAIYFANLFGPPPPSVSAVAWSAQALWVIVVLGFWIDRHRKSVYE